MRRPVFLPAFLLALVLIGAKGILVWRHMRGMSAKLLLTISGEDVIFAIALGIVAAVAMRATARRPRVQRITWYTFLATCALAGVYAMVNVGIFQALGYPLNARMFALAGRFKDLRSSLVEHCDIALLIGMFLAVAVFVIASHRRLRIRPAHKVRWIMLGIATLWIFGSVTLRAHREPDSWIGRAGKSPHREMLVSLAKRLVFDRRAELVTPFPPEYLNDFRPAAAYAHPALPQFAKPPRNVLMIVLESTAAKYMSLYGARFDTTPNLVAESSHALVFDRVYAHVGYTFCSRIPLMYSTYPGLPWSYCPNAHQTMPPGLATLMKARGARTAFFSAADPEWDSLMYVAQDAGLDEIFGPAELGGRMASSWGTEDGIVTDGLIKWIDADRSRPFFAVMWTDQTHDPYTLSADTKPVDFLAGVDPQPPHAEDFNRYLNAMRQADRHVGRIFEMLRSRGLADDTLVVITGDHGEAFGDPHEVMGHGGGLFEENLRVPLMIWNPRLFPAAQRFAQVGGHVDINPTLAQILGIEFPPDWQGASLFSPDHPGRVYMLADLSDYQFGLTDNRYKYIYHFTDAFERLFDLTQDPLEQRDLSAEHPEITGAFRARVSAFVHAEEEYLKAAVSHRP
jgi:glucan phosphoethanolaminetransferase (alkaline phosphatase superfamily)